MNVIQNVENKQDQARNMIAQAQAQLNARVGILRVEVDVINKQLWTEHQDYLDKRNQIRSDIKIIHDKIDHQIEELNEDVAYFKRAISVNGKVFGLIREMILLQHLMQT